MKLIKVAQPFAGKEEARAVGEVILSGRYVSGAKVKEFEDKFAEYLHVKYAVAVNSGTAALHIALAVLNIGAGDEIVVPPLTFFSTISAVLYQNAAPIFADIDLESYCMDPEGLKRRITPATKAIIPVHLYGNSADMGAIMQIAKKYNLRVIEDTAQAHGTEYKGKKAGSIGDIGCFSFFATKHMTTGEGGMLVTNSKRWASLARMLRSHGMSDRDHHDYLGYNYRMNEMAAAMGIIQLKKLDRFNEKRIKNSLYLIRKLNRRNIPWLKAPRPEKYIKHTFFWCPVLIHEEILGVRTGELIKELKENGIEVRHRYREPLYKQKILQDKKGDLKNGEIYLENAEKVAGKIIGLPNHGGLTKRDLDYVIDTLSNVKKSLHSGKPGLQHDGLRTNA